MSLFTLPPAQQAANQVIVNGNQLYDFLISQYVATYNLVWNDPNPDQVVAAMGTNAVKIFTASAAIAVCLVSLGASVPTTTPQDSAGNAKWLVTANPDGSMSLATNPAYTGS